MAENSLIAVAVKRKSASLSEWARRYFKLWRSRLYRWKLNGKEGLLDNGVRWWLSLPRNPEQDRKQTMLQLNFSDNTAHGFIADAYNMATRFLEPEYNYTSGKQSFKQSLAVAGFEPATPEDPKAFWVKWIEKNEK